MKKSLAIITVVYENYDVTQDFLSSLAKQKNKNFHVFLTNLSKTRSPDGWPVYPERSRRGLPSGVITVINGDNEGYAYGINLGLKKALDNECQYFCVINNDTYFKEDFVDSVLNSIINHPSSILGGKIYYAPGFEYHKTKYLLHDRGQVIWYAGGQVDWDNVVTPHRGVDQVDNKQYNQFEKTDFITGCLMVLDKKVIETVGLFDESYFLYFEDADYCERAKRKGINLYYNPKIVIWHKNAQSTEGSGSKIHQKYQDKNRLKFGLKYAPLKTKLHLLKNLFYKSIGS